MLDALIKEGRLLHDRIQKHYDPGHDALPPEERITVAELQAWYDGVTKALEQQFGSESIEATLWRDGLERISKESSEQVGQPHTRHDGYFVNRHLTESLGLLTQIKLVRLKGTSGPGFISFASLHPSIAVKCQSLFAAGSYDAAVFEAFRIVEDAVRTRTGAPATDVGVGLMSNVMGPKAARIRFSNIAAEQEGYHSLFRGAMGAIKNPASHRAVGHTDPVRVMELLAFASLLMRLLDDSAKVH